MRRTLLPLLLLAAALAPAAGAGAHAGLTSCRPSDLSGRVGSSTGAAGTIGVAVVLHNRSQTTCTLRGYEPLRLYRPHGFLPTTVRHGGLAPLNRPVRTVTLHPGGNATILIAYHDVPTGSQRCLTSTALFVLSIGRLDGVPVSVRAMACGGVLLESPVIPGIVHSP